MFDQVQQERDVRLDAPDAELAQGAVGPLLGLLERGAPGGDLREQRIEVRRDDRAAEAVAAVEPDREAAGRPVRRDAAVVRHEVAVRILGRHPALHGDAADVDVVLRRDVDRGVVQPVAVGQENLAPHEIDAGHHFRDGMLDLDARVHLDEEKVAALDVEQKLHRAGIAIAHGAAEPHRRVADPRPQLLGERDARRDLDDLLVPALHRTVALPEMNESALAIAEDLDLDVFGARDVALEEHVRVAEGGRRLPLGFLELGGQLAGAVHDPHAASAAAEAGLDHQRVAHALGRGRHIVGALERVLGAGNCRHAGLLRETLGRGLVAKNVDLLRRGADELHAGLGARAGERRVLGKEAVAGMDGVDLRLLRDGDDRIDVQIRAHRLAAGGGTDEKRFVGLESMERETIFVAVDRDGSQAELGGGPETADGDFRTIGDEQFLDLVGFIHGGFHRS